MEIKMKTRRKNNLLININVQAVSQKRPRPMEVNDFDGFFSGEREIAAYEPRTRGQFRRELWLKAFHLIRKQVRKNMSRFGQIDFVEIAPDKNTFEAENSFFKSGG